MKIGVIGLGIMGGGIAQVSAVAGHDVIATDVSRTIYEKAVATIGKSLDQLLEKQVITGNKADILGRIKFTEDYKEFSDCSIVVEAIVENLESKREFYRKIEPHLKSDAILASNTSSISITALAAATRRPDRFIGIHFFNPVPLMNLVELIRGVRTSDETVQRGIDYVKTIKKEYVVVNDAPGFVTTRIIVMLVNEGAFEYSEGLATKEDIDKALKFGGNFPMGPLTLGDLIGLDTVVNIMDVMYESYKDPKYRAAPILRKMVEAGKLGRKTGEGFYKY